MYQYFKRIGEVGGNAKIIAIIKDNLIIDASKDVRLIGFHFGSVEKSQTKICKFTKREGQNKANIVKLYYRIIHD